MTNGELIQKVFNCEVCEPIPEEDIIHVIFPDKNDSAIGFDLSWWNMEHKASTTKNDLGVDCISRKSIKQKLQEHHDFFVDAYGGFSNLPLNDKSRVDEITNCIAMVVNEPPVTPQEPRRGHWIDTHDNAFVHFRVYKCSHCGAIFCDYPKNLKKYKYCSDCGCRMVEPQESEEQTEGK